MKLYRSKYIKKFCSRLLTCLAGLLLTFVVNAQEPASPLGSVKTAVKILGRAYVDSALYMPVKPATWTPLRQGAVTFDTSVLNFKGWDGTQWKSFGGGGSDELDTIVAFNGTSTNFTFPHTLSYTPATATIALTDTSYGIPDYTLDASNIYLKYSAAPVGTYSFKISFHRRAEGTQVGGSGGSGGGSDGNNYTASVAFDNTNYNLTTIRSGLASLITNLSHTHTQAQIINLADSLISKANKTGTNASGTWPISITGSATETDPKRITTAVFTGTTTKTLTLTKADATTITASFNDDASGGGGGGAVSSVFARTGDIVSVNGDYQASQITNIPTGFVTSTNVQAAINQLDALKLNGNSAITAGTYTKLTVDFKGLVTGGSSIIAADIPNLDIAKITTGNWPVSRGGTGLTAFGTALQVLRVNAAGTALEYATPAGSGTVTTFSAGNLSPLFTSAVVNASTTPALSFTLTNAAANTVYGNNTNASATPTFFVPTLASTLFKNQGTTTLLLHGNAAGNPSWGQVSLTADVVGTLPIANGGTNAATATAATNNLLPAQTGNAGKSLQTDGTNTSWVVPAGTANKAFLALTDGATIAWDYTAGFNAVVTLTGNNHRIALSSDATGDYGTIFFIQNATGGFDAKVPAGDKMLDGIGTGTLETLALEHSPNAVNICTWVRRGTIRYWTKGWYH